MLEVLEFCFRDFGTFLGSTLWLLIIGYSIGNFRLVENNVVYTKEEECETDVVKTAQNDM